MGVALECRNYEVNWKQSKMGPKQKNFARLIVGNCRTGTSARVPSQRMLKNRWSWFPSQVLATLEVGPKSNIVIYELKPTRRRKTIAISLAAEPKDSTVAFAFSPDGKLLATLLPEMATPLSYSVAVYMWRTGKIVASVGLGCVTLPTFIPQVSTSDSDQFIIHVNVFHAPHRLSL